MLASRYSTPTAVSRLAIFPFWLLFIGQGEHKCHLHRYLKVSFGKIREKTAMESDKSAALDMLDVFFLIK